MRRIAICSVSLAAALVVPAQAKSPKPHPPKSHHCTPHSVGYRASGALVEQALTQTAGAGTSRRGDDRYSGTLTVDVSRANHRAATGEQTYTLDDARVRFYDADHNGTADKPKAGDRVKVRGKTTRLAKKCDSTGFEPTVTVRGVNFKPAKPAAQPTS